MRLPIYQILFAYAILFALAITGSVDAAITEETLDLSLNDTYYRTADDGTNFYVTTEDVGSSGTGLINSFLRVQKSGSEQGFNHDRSTAVFDEGPSQTDSLEIDLVSTFIDGPDLGGTGLEYGEFLLDINEGVVSLNQVQIFAVGSITATDPNLIYSSYTAATADDAPLIDFAASAGDPLAPVEVFRMSGADLLYDVWVPSSGSGSGTYDMRLFIEWGEISALLDAGYTHLIFYSQFGSPPGQQGSASGFEEWSTARDDIANIPEPSTWAMLLITACGAIFLQFRKQRKMKLAGDSAA